MHTWRVLVPQGYYTIWTRSYGISYPVPDSRSSFRILVPRSESSFLIPNPRSSFRILVPDLTYRFITPSPPSEKEASLTPGIIYTIILLTLVRAIPVLKTRNSLKKYLQRWGSAEKAPRKSLPCAGDHPWSA